MQQPTYLDDLNFIVESIDIGPEGKLSFLGKPFEGYDYPEASPEAQLFHNLSNLLYSACYTRRQESSAANFTNTEKVESLLPALSAANASANSYDSGWLVEEIEHSGKILVRKGGYKRYTYAGDFIREHFGQGALQRGELVNIRVLKEYGAEPENGEVFYYVFGETLLDNNNSAVVRIYFNLLPQGAASLVAFISKKLNQYNIPFQFKCLSDPAQYTRCDSAVLYFDKRYFSLITDLILEGYPELKNYLNPALPMFVKTVAPGIGFAENPFSTSESFGTSRCKIIAQGITNAWKEHKPKNDWIDFILKNVHQNYLNPEALYLNPNSKYPYHFPNFEN